MGKRVRLDPHVEAMLERTARALGVSPSELMHEAIVRRCQEVLQPSLAERLGPVVGIVHSAGGRASDTGAAFRKALARRLRDDSTGA